MSVGDSAAAPLLPTPTDHLVRAVTPAASLRSAAVLDILEFDVTVKFPVSLVISRKNMIRWKFLHTILIQLKVTERQLSDVWLEQQAKHWQTRSTPSHPELEGWKMRVFKLRHRMTFFVQNVLAFFTGEIIEPNWGKLEERMVGARTVDQFLRDHTDFLNECRKECMLTDVRFVEVSKGESERGEERAFRS